MGNPAYLAASKFLGVDARYHPRIGFVDETRDPTSHDVLTNVRCSFRSSKWNGQHRICLMIPSTWREHVLGRKLHDLPPMPNQKSIFVLHAEEMDIGVGMHLSPAIYTPGGDQVKHGWLAWQTHPWTKEVTAWATGTTPMRASKKLLATRRIIDANASGPMPEEDLAALEGLVL
jgi:hypothetical protein